MVRVEDLNITFFHLPKNAGTSIANWLSDNVNGEEYMDDLRHGSPESLKPLFDDFGWSFCCVRNPWDRMVSWYNFFKGQNKIHICFPDFVDAVFDPSKRTKKYLLPVTEQMIYVRDVDYILRYENLLEDFKLVQEKTNCFKPLGHHNPSNRTKYLDYYIKDHHIKVKNYYAEEIEYFGYEFGE